MAGTLRVLASRESKKCWPLNITKLDVITSFIMILDIVFNGKNIEYDDVWKDSPLSDQNLNMEFDNG